MARLSVRVVIGWKNTQDELYLYLRVFNDVYLSDRSPAKMPIKQNRANGVENGSV